MSINEFHSKLALRNDQSTLFHALRRLRLLDDVKRMAAAEEGGWILWADDTQGPADDGSSFRLVTAVA